MNNSTYASSSPAKIAEKISRKSLTLETKLNVLKRLDSGKRQVDVCSALGLAGSTVRTIIKNKKKILECGRIATPLGAMKLNRARPAIMVEMERLLNFFIKNNIEHGIPLSLLIIQEKAISLYEDLRKTMPEGSSVEPFNASKGWFDRFKRRSNLHNICIQGEAAKANHRTRSPKVKKVPSCSSDAATQCVAEEQSSQKQACKNQELQKQILRERSLGESISVSKKQKISQKDADATITSSTAKGIHSVATVEQPEFKGLIHNGYKLQHNNHQMLVLESLAEDEAFMDLTLTSQGRAIKAHKSVLSAMSPYFRRVLTDNPCQHPIIVMPRDIQFDELKNLITYIYKGEVTVPFQEVSSLLKTARTLEIKGLNEVEHVQNTETLSKDHNLFEGTRNASRYPSVTPERIMQHTEASTWTLSKAQEETDDFKFIFVKEELLSDCEEPPLDGHQTTDAAPCISSRPYGTSSETEERGTKHLRVSPNLSRRLSPYPPGNGKNDFLPFKGKPPSDTKDKFAISDYLPQVESFRCSSCTRSYKSLECLRSHLSLEHQLYDPFICDCGVAFLQQSILDSHKMECYNRHTPKI